MSAGQVLIVDDEALMLSALALHLDATGLVTHTVCSGPGALRALQDGRFDLVVRAVSTRSGHALNVLRELRGLGLWIPVVVIGGYDMAPLAAQATRLGGDLREKPVDPDELGRCGEALDRRSSPFQGRIAPPSVRPWAVDAS